MRKKKLLSFVLCMTTAAMIFAGCSSKKNKDAKDTAKGKVYFLNFKPEIAEYYEDLMKKYTQETGVEAKVVTAADNQYDATLSVEMAKTDAPTIFTVNGYMGYDRWKDSCADLKDTKFYSLLNDKDQALVDGDGVFSMPALNATSNWRFTNHLFNVPLNYEYHDAGLADKEEIQFSYAPQMKNIVDLYLDNSVDVRENSANGSVEDAMAEFATGKVAMVQNGTWAWGEQIHVDGSVVSAEDLYFMPIYTGIAGEEKQGLCTGTENYVCVNANASKDDIKASEDFLEWLYTSETGKSFVLAHYGIAPFDGIDNDKIADSNPLVKLALEDINNSDTNNVAWSLTTVPSQNWKDAFGADLLGYAQGSVEWDTVVNNAKQNWASEKAQAEQ